MATLLVHVPIYTLTLRFIESYNIYLSAFAYNKVIFKLLCCAANILKFCLLAVFKFCENNVKMSLWLKRTFKTLTSRNIWLKTRERRHS